MSEMWAGDGAQEAESPKHTPQGYTHKETIAPGKRPLIRLDLFVANWFRCSRNRAHRAVVLETIWVNGELQSRPSYLVRPFDHLRFVLPYPPPPPALPEDIPLVILYEDDDVLVIDKPPYLFCHPCTGNHSGTIVNGILHHLGKKGTEKRFKEDVSTGLVHRLDRDTSGVMVFAKNDRALQHLSDQFFHRKTERLYNAIAWGEVPKEVGRIDCNLGVSERDEKGWQAFPKNDKGKRAVTHYRVLERFRTGTWIQCKLETGRTHQIRLHLHHIGHPLVGDPLYDGVWEPGVLGVPEHDAHIQRCLGWMKRQALHAATLGFLHPRKQEWMAFESAMPDDFRQLMDEMKSFGARWQEVSS